MDRLPEFLLSDLSSPSLLLSLFFIFIMIKSMDSGCFGFKSQLGHILAVCPRASYLIFLCVGFLSCKMKY